MALTTIQLRVATRLRLARLKRHGRESYDELLNRLMAMVPEGDEEGAYTEAFRSDLLEARAQVRRGKLVILSVVKKRLGL